MRGMDAGPVLDSFRGVGAPVRTARRSLVLRRGSRAGDTGWVAEQDPRIARGGECSDIERMLSLLQEFRVIDATAAVKPDRALATVLFTDIVDSTRHAVALGDCGWRRVLDHHDGIAQSAVDACGGQLVKGTGDGMLATFDSPAHGLDCAKTVRDALAHAGIAIRAGVHTGEVELRHNDVAGVGVNIAARVAALAGAGELLASRTVRDLVAGAGYAFTSRGHHSLKGIPGRWELLAVR
jgi:class 3 adenylate cyclase